MRRARRAGWEARPGGGRGRGVRGSRACTPGRQSGRLRGLPASTVIFFFLIYLFVCKRWCCRRRRGGCDSHCRPAACCKLLSRRSSGRRSGDRRRRRISLRPRAGAAVRGRWPRGEAAAGGVGCGGAALRCQRPRLAPRGTVRAPPRLCSPSSAPLLLRSSLPPWVSGLRGSRGGPGPEDAGFPSLTAAGPARRLGTRLPRCRARRAACCPARPPGKAGAPALTPCAAGRCFLLLRGRAAGEKPEAGGDRLPAFDASSRLTNVTLPCLVKNLAKSTGRKPELLLLGPSP